MEMLAVTLMGAFDKSTPLGGQQGAVFGCDYPPTEILRCSLPTPIRAGLVRRARMILLLADGVSITDIAATVGISRRHAYK